jgi:hypothetical protein
MAFANRLAVIDNRNRARPGITRQINAAAVPIVVASYFGGGLYLLSDGTNLWSYSTLTKVLTLLTTGLPFVAGAGSAPINSCPGGNPGTNAALFLNQGAGLYYWDGTNLNTVSMPTASPNMSYPIWFSNRLVTARTGTNDVVFGDLGAIPPNFGPGNNDLSVRVTLDAEGSDAINGLMGFQVGVVLAAKKGKIYAIYADPTATVANFHKQIVSSVVGVAEHNTMRQIGNDALMLSESANGVFRLSTLQGTDNVGVTDKLSARIQPDINRINWNVIYTSRAIVWQDLYILAVPLDGSTVPNALLVYSVPLDEWQGIWTGTNQDGSTAVWRALFANPSAPGGSELLYAFQNGDVGLQTKPQSGLFNDVAIDGVTPIPIVSSILSRGFHWDSTIVPPSAGGQPYNTKFLNQVQPYNVRLRFSQSVAPVTVDVITDTNETDGVLLNLSTTTKVLQLPHDLPWNLDTTGDQYASFNVQGVAGECNELQVRLTGTGDWRLHKMDATAFISKPKDNL